MRMPSTPMSVRDRKSDTSGKSPRSASKASGDKSHKVGASPPKGQAAGKASKGRKPNGPPGARQITRPGGAKTYHNR